MNTVLPVILILLSAIILFPGYCRSCAARLFQAKPVRKILESVRSEESFLPLSEIDPLFIRLLISAEDLRFYEHHGYDLTAIFRAIRHDLNNLTNRSEWVGASTITQQLSRNLYLNHDRTFIRKLKEFFLTLMIERELTKDEILELYCNILYFGLGIYGIRNGSLRLIGKLPQSLTMNECLTILSVIPGPNVANPLKRDDPNQIRRFCMWRETKIGALLYNGTITEKEAESLRAEGWPLPEEETQTPEDPFAE